MLENFTKQINSLTKLRLLVSALFFVIALSLSNSTSQYLPSVMSVTLGQWQTGPFSVYLDTGKGFNEEESYHQPLTRIAGKHSTLYFLLPGDDFKLLRIDPGNQQGKVSIHDICLYGILGSKCWSPQSIEKEFSPLHGISGFEVNGDALDLIVSGDDPYFSIRDPLVFEGSETSEILTWLTFLLSISLSVLVFYLSPIFLRPHDSFNRVTRWCRQYRFQITLYQLSAISILFSLLASGLWLELDQLGPWFNLGLFTFLTFLAFTRLDPGSNFMYSPGYLDKPGCPDFKSMVSGFFWGMVVIAPIAIYLGLTWSQEFPYIGDNQYHKSAFISSFFFWNSYGSFALIFIGTGLLAALVLRLRVWIPLAFLFLIASSYFGSSPAAFFRYPGIGRVFGNMLLWVTIDHSQWDSFFNILRTSNALAVVVWVFALRPLVIRRWPGIGILPFAFLFFYQQEVVDYFTSAYLEPWALIFVLLGVELVIVGKTVRSHGVACLLVGMAALIKEQMIFVLPFVWLASQPWKAGERIVKIVCGFAAIIPFFTYYLIRKDADVSRGFSMASFEHIFSLERLSVFADRLQFHFGLAGILLILALISLYPYLLIKLPELRVKILALAGAFLGQIMFFYLDGGSLNHVGYPRFLLAAYMLLCAFALFLPYLFKGHKTELRMLSVATGILILQGFMLIPYSILALKPSPARNFSQHYDHPVYLPIADLIEQAEDQDTLRSGQVIYVADPTGWDLSSINSDYSKLGKKYKFKTGPVQKCRCGPENSATITSFIYFANLNSDLPEDLNELPLYARAPMSFYHRWREVNKRRPQCIKELMATCRYHFKTTVDDEIVGVMGVGYK